jgi:hypothetical protein
MINKSIQGTEGNLILRRTTSLLNKTLEQS